MRRTTARDPALERLLLAAGKAVEKRKQNEWNDENKRYQLLLAAAASPLSLSDLSMLFMSYGEEHKPSAFHLALARNNPDLALKILVLLGPADQANALSALADNALLILANAQHIGDPLVFVRIFRQQALKIFLLALEQNNNGLAVAAFQLILSEKRLAIFLGLNFEQSTRVFKFLNQLRKDSQGSRLDQAHLNAQMANVADCLENKALAKLIRQKAGFCFAWSSSEASLSVLGYEAFWDAAKLLLSMWSGTRESLDQLVFLPQIAEPVALKDLFSWLVNSEVTTQQLRLGDASLLGIDEATKTLFAPLDSPQEQEIFRPASELPFFAVRDRRVQGEFSLDQLKAVLSKVVLEDLERNGYVAISTGLHAVHFQTYVREDGCRVYRVFDSNQAAGRQSFDRLSLAAQEILAKQGSALALTDVRVMSSRAAREDKSQQNPSASLYPQGKFQVTNPQFFSLFLTAKPEELPEILAANQIMNPDIWNQPFKLYQSTALEPDRAVIAPLLFYAVQHHRVDLVKMLLEQPGAKPSIISMALAVEGKLSLRFFEGLAKTFHFCFDKLKTTVGKQLALCGLIDLAEKCDGDFHWLIIASLIESGLEQAGFSTFSKSLFPVVGDSYMMGESQKALYRKKLLDWQRVAKPKPKLKSSMSDLFKPGSASKPSSQIRPVPVIKQKK